jgi:hypothetical protein
LVREQLLAAGATPAVRAVRAKVEAAVLAGELTAAQAAQQVLAAIQWPVRP